MDFLRRAANATSEPPDTPVPTSDTNNANINASDEQPTMPGIPGDNLGDSSSGSSMELLTDEVVPDELLNEWNDVAAEFPTIADFICPLSSRVMQDPVKAEDGFTYERSTIEDWLATRDTSPQLPGVTMGSTLVPDHERRDAIRAFIAAKAAPEVRGRRYHLAFPECVQETLSSSNSAPLPRTHPTTPKSSSVHHTCACPLLWSLSWRDTKGGSYCSLLRRRARFSNPEISDSNPRKKTRD